MDKNLLKVNDHRRTMALLCLKTKKHLNEIYKKPALAKKNCDSIQLFRERLLEKVHTKILKGIVGRF